MPRLLLLLLPTHPVPLAPLRASPCPGARLHYRLPFTSSPAPLPPLYGAPRPRWPPPLRARASGEAVRGGGGTIDALLSASELLCLAPPAVYSVVCAARLVFTRGSASAGSPLAGGRLFFVQCVLLVGAVVIGSLIRRRQWERLRGAGGKVGAGLAGRFEKMEESVRGMVAAVGVLSRTVEKLGVRFRVLRRTLRDPIGETAALAQKNSEATTILAAQGNLLEKEIGAIQKVLYAMQEQQEKQLELILAIGEASKMLDHEQGMLDDTTRSSTKTPARETRNKEVQINTQAVKKAITNHDLSLEMKTRST